jgi:hypothetical protein
MSASRDGRNDGQLIAVANGRIEATAEADVFVVQVVGHERIRLIVLVDESSREWREAAAQISDGLTDGGAGSGDDAGDGRRGLRFG